MDWVHSIITRFWKKRKGYRDLVLAGLIGLTGAGGFMIGRASVATERTGITVMSPHPVEDFLELPENAEGVRGIPAAAAASGILPDATTAVVASVSGSVYHLPECPGAQRIKPENIITFANAAEARAAGYRPAANCPGL